MNASASILPLSFGAVQAQQLSEILDFAEQERLTLLEKEVALQQDLNQVCLQLLNAFYLQPSIRINNLMQHLYTWTSVPSCNGLCYGSYSLRFCP